ncbi:MAG: MFS transporter, partial [Desulfobacterales bacterium]|nr:MFS transporter [Desulfobacterales bacterium]
VTQTLSPAIAGLAANFWHICIGRFLFEIKSVHPTQVLINRWFVRKRGRALGAVATGMPIGTLVLSPVSQYMVLVWGWRETLLFWSGVTFVAYLSLVLFIRNSPEDKGCRPDSESARPAPDYKPERPDTDRMENHSGTGNSSSLSEAFKSASFYLLSGTQLFCGVGCGFMMTHTVIFATDLGYSAMIGATFLSVQGGVNLIGVLLTGYMSDRVARSKMLALTHFIRSVSFVIIAGYIFMSGSSLWVMYIAMALFGFGWFTTAPLSSGLVADLFGYVRMGTIMGVVMSCHVIGMAIGAYAGGITFELTGSYYTFFVIQAILEFMAAFFAFIIRQKKPA